jgi:hypothetical protein
MAKCYACSDKKKTAIEKTLSGELNLKKKKSNTKPKPKPVFSLISKNGRILK